MAPPAPRPIPPEVMQALKERNLGKLARVLLAASAANAAGQATAQPARTQAPPPSPPASSASRQADPALPLVAGKGLSPGEVPRGGSAFWIWVVVVLVAYLGYRLVRG